MRNRTKKIFIDYQTIKEETIDFINFMDFINFRLI